MFRLGKLPAPLLRELLAQYKGAQDSRVVVGPGIGMDAAAIDFGTRYVLAKTDPITLVGEEVGAYALTINANDLATMGARPRWFLVTILLPPETTKRQVLRLTAQLDRECRRLRVALCGGHTEITDAVTRPVVVGSLLGECPREQMISTAGARPGDVILLTKGIPIEAVSILAREKTDELRRHYSGRFVSRCRRYLADPGISVVRDAQVAMRAGGVHAMHDPTEGGLSAALYELAEAAGVGVLVEEAAIRVLPEGAKLCAHFGLNPLGAIASGALLICAEPESEGVILRRLSRAGIQAMRIGTVVPSGDGVRMRAKRGRVHPMPRFLVDEIARLFSTSRRRPAPRAKNRRGNRLPNTAS